MSGSLTSSTGTRDRRAKEIKVPVPPKDDEKEFRGVKLTVIRQSLDEVEALNDNVLVRVGARALAIEPKYKLGYGDLNPLWLDYKIPERCYPIWAEEGYFPICSPGARSQPHPNLGAGRNLAEINLVKEIVKYSNTLGKPIRVVDIGSNAMRLRAVVASMGVEHFFEEIHHMIPVIQQGDKRRREQARLRFPTCECHMQTCPHILDADVLLAQHSIYYATPEELIEIIGHRTLFATLHLIDDACGALQKGELVWYVGEDGLAHCRAQGNSSYYVHPTNAWMREDGYVSNGKTLVWERLYSAFESHLYQFSVVNTELTKPKGLETMDETKLDALNHQLSHLTNEFSSWDGGNLQQFKLQKVTLRFGLPIVYDADANKRVYTLPRDLVGTLALKLAALPRDRVTMGVAFDVARRFLAKSDYPRELSAKIITIAVTMAMVSGVEDTTAKIGRLNQLYNPLFKVHNDVLKGEPIRTWRWYHWFWKMDPRTYWQQCCGDEHHTDEAETYIASRAVGITPRVTQPTRLESGTKLWPVYEHKSTNVAIREDAKIKVLEKDGEGDVRMPNVELYLIAFDGSPTTAKRGKSELLQGIKVRLARKVPPENERAWLLLIAKLDDPDSILYGFNHGATYGDMIHDSDALFDEWVKRYPKGEQTKFRAARADMKREGYKPEYSKTSAHIKVEKSAMIYSDTGAVLDPRIIQAFTPHHTATCGPLNWATTSRERRDYDGIGCSACWVNGENATLDGFGELWRLAIEETPNGKTFFGDHEKFEAHWGELRFMFHEAVARRQIDESQYYDFLRQEIVMQGVTQDHTIAFIIDWILGSGNTKTTKVNGEANVAALTHSFGEPKRYRTYFFYNGDDWLVRTSDLLGPEIIENRMLDLGFETSVNEAKNDYEIEFCQLIPYPIDNGTKIVWGPKIGRVLSRLPWKSNSNSDDDPRGVALGLRTSVSHIPFLREYIERIIELSPRVKAVKSEYKTYASTAYTYDHSTMAFVYARYGLTDSDLDDFKSMLAGVSSLRTIVHWPRLRHCAEVDQ
jgi:hypothetical protein